MAWVSLSVPSAAALSSSPHAPPRKACKVSRYGPGSSLCLGGSAADAGRVVNHKTQAPRPPMSKRVESFTSLSLSLGRTCALHLFGKSFALGLGPNLLAGLTLLGPHTLYLLCRRRSSFSLFCGFLPLLTGRTLTTDNRARVVNHDGPTSATNLLGANTYP